MEIHALTEADAPAAAALIGRAIAATAGRVYTEAQAAAWAAGADPERVRRALTATEGLGARIDGDLAGLATLDVARGVLDLLYVDPAAQGRGVGRALVRAVEALARERGVQELRADASLLAAPMLAACGWQRAGDHAKTVGGQCFANVWMVSRSSGARRDTSASRP